MVNPPYTPFENFGMVSWDYSSYLRTPHKAQENMKEHFASTHGHKKSKIKKTWKT